MIQTRPGFLFLNPDICLPTRIFISRPGFLSPDPDFYLPTRIFVSCTVRLLLSRQVRDKSSLVRLITPSLIQRNTPKLRKNSIKITNKLLTDNSRRRGLPHGVCMGLIRGTLSLTYYLPREIRRKLDGSASNTTMPQRNSLLIYHAVLFLYTRYGSIEFNGNKQFSTAVRLRIKTRLNPRLTMLFSVPQNAIRTSR